MHYELDNCEDRNRENPETFWIASREERESIEKGNFVKLIFMDPEGENGGERMWVEVMETHTGSYTGRLRNTPIELDLEFDEEIEFAPEHVADIEED